MHTIKELRNQRLNNENTLYSQHKTMKSLILLVAATVLFALLAHAAPVQIHRRGNEYHGKATWFVPADEGGPIGSCGPEEDENSAIVALNHGQYGNMDAVSKWCGKKIKVKGPHGSMVVTINDACPGCGKESLVSSGMGT